MKTDEIVMSCHLLYNKKLDDYRVVSVCYGESIETSLEENENENENKLKENEIEVGMTNITADYGDGMISKLFGEFGYEKTCSFISDMMIRAIHELLDLSELISIDKNAQPNERKVLHSPEFQPLFDYIEAEHCLAYASNFCLTLMETGMYMLPLLKNVNPSTKPPADVGRLQVFLLLTFHPGFITIIPSIKTQAMNEILFQIYPVYQKKDGIIDYRFICFPPDVAVDQMICSLKNGNEDYLLYDTEIQKIIGRYGKKGILYYNNGYEPQYGEESRLLTFSIGRAKAEPYMLNIWDYSRKTQQVHLLFQLINGMVKIGLKLSYAQCRQEVSAVKSLSYCDHKLEMFLKKYSHLQSFYRELRALLHNDESESKFRQMFYNSVSLLSDILTIEVVIKQS